ncbi:PAQR family membrane homeostasis protein TrhA [Rhizobium tumorigenes]|uniref:PAQR family membrane homeostasis protein TrhA n=1 Tax=Rhizobium tumorigenes TaxID=2041385 RepID=UPI00241CD1B0|nr:hemolysin III family protein [Rhizobium tumorigenes]WFS01712.1 hemolysin III family protein [Rhizobium tumorigenes]
MANRDAHSPVVEFRGIRRAYDKSEIIADSIVNGVGVVLALIGATVLIVYATLWRSEGEIAAAWIYGLGLVLTMTMSFSYNIWPVSPTKWILRRFDHSAIFVLIAATYTPFLERGADDPLLLSTLIALWVFAAIGIVLKCGFPGRYDRLAILLYLAMGWSGVLVAEPVAARIPSVSMLLIVVGGVVYSLGVIFHVWEKLRFQNAIWHAFVLTAAGIHYAAVMTCFSLSPPASL